MPPQHDPEEGSDPPKGGDAPWSARVSAELAGVVAAVSRLVSVHAARAELRARSLLGSLLILGVVAIALLSAVVIGVWMLLSGLSHLVSELTGRPYLGPLIVGSITLAGAVFASLLLRAVLIAQGEKSARTRLARSRPTGTQPPPTP